MTGRPWIIVDLVIIATFEALVPEEMDGLVMDARQSLGRICLGLNMLQTVRLVPTMREYVERDLPANRIPGGEGGVVASAEKSIARKTKKTLSKRPLSPKLV